MCRSLKGILGSALVIAALACPVVAQAADTVHSGWDLLLTEPGTGFGGAAFVGVPLGTYDFGAAGVHYVGSTDTIIHRLSDVNTPGGTTPLVLDAWHLQTPGPARVLGGPLGKYYLTLQSERGGPASVGSETIDSGTGTWTSTLDIFYDLRFGSLNGPIVNSSDMPVSATADWQHDGTGVNPLIPGVNYLLDGIGTSEDFFPAGTAVFSGPGLVQLVSAVPEPASGSLVLFGGIALFGLRQYRRKLSR